MKPSLSYLTDIERRHSMSAERRSMGEHIHGMPSVAECGPGEVCNIDKAEAPGGRKGGRANPGKGEGTEKYQ